MNLDKAARILFRLGEEDGKIVWWWQRLTLVAAKVWLIWATRQIAAAIED